jgi:hypothetical protein
MGAATHEFNIVVSFAVGRMPISGAQGCAGYWFGKCQTAGFVLVYHLIYGAYSRTAPRTRHVYANGVITGREGVNS